MLLMLHLSDLHLRGTESANSVFRKISRLPAAARELSIIRERRVTDVIVVISGDVAYSGEKQQYDLASTLLALLTAAIQEVFGVVPHYVIAPGNHDCDYKKSTGARELLIGSVDPTKVDASVVDICASTQVDFRAFRDAHGVVEHGNPLLRRSLVILSDGKRVQFDVYNTAWMSSLHEVPGALVFPPSLALLPDDLLHNADLNVAVLHHPFNWFEPNNSRIFRGAVERIADVILTGHEHVPDGHRKVKPSGSHDYLEGGALQPHGESDESAFNILAVDLDAKTQIVAQVSWADSRYSVESEAAETPLLRERDSYRRAFPFNKNFVAELYDVGAAYGHPQKDKLELIDIFVYPDLFEVEMLPKTERSRQIREQHVDRIVELERVLVIGEEFGGKTALARMLVADLHQRGIVPLLLSGKKLRSPKPKDVDEWVRTAFSQQYGSQHSLWCEYTQAPKGRRALVVDDLHYFSADARYREQVCAQLVAQADLLVMFAINDWGFDQVQAAQPGLETLWSLRRLRILEMGHLKRHDLIAKWCHLGAAFSIDTVAVWTKVERLEKRINVAIQNSLMPSYACNVLMLLSLLEANDGGTAKTSAVLYESMITNRLARAGDASKITTLYEYLSVFAYRIFERKNRDIDVATFRHWHRDYCDKYDLELEVVQVLRQCCEAQVLREQHGRVGFRYPYGFYYFVARYLSRHLNRDEVRAVVVDLCQKTHLEQAGNIMLFLCYLTSDDFVLDEIVRTAGSRFDAYAEFDVETLRAGFLRMISNSAPAPTLPAGTTAEKRREVRALQDEAESNGLSSRQATLETAEADDDGSLLNDLHGSFKTIELLGEILRSYPGSILSDRKRQLAEHAYGLTLRTIDWWCTEMEKAQDDLVIALTHLIGRRWPNERDPEVIRARIQQWFFAAASGWATWMIRQLTSAVGSDALSPTFRAIAEQHCASKASYGLIDLSIKLDLNRAYPRHEIASMAARLKGNAFALAVVRSLVLHHVRLFPVAHGDQQFSASKLGMRLNHPDFTSAKTDRNKKQPS